MIYLTTESNQPSVDKDFSFLSYVDVNAMDSLEQYQEKVEVSKHLSNSDVNLGTNMFQIGVSNKITKKNGTLYLAVFSVPKPEGLKEGKFLVYKLNINWTC